MKSIIETTKNIDTTEFMKQKEWLQTQILALEPSGTDAVRFPEGILHMMDEIQDAAENDLGMRFQTEETKTFFVPFAYERYGRMPIEASPNATIDEIHELAEERLCKMSVGDMDEYADYLSDSEEVDFDGSILDDAGNIVNPISSHIEKVRSEQQQEDLEAFGIVMIIKEGNDGLSRSEINEIMDKIGSYFVYPIELQAHFAEYAAMGFITREAAKIIDYDYEQSGLHDFIASILEDINPKHDNGIYEFKGIRIWMNN